MVVDDEAEVLAGITSILKRANFEVLATTKGRDVLKLTQKFKPDLIILDIILPDIDGSEVALNLAENPFTSDTPILFLTGIIRKQEESVVDKIGKSYVMAKPVTVQELLKMVNKILPN